MFWAKKGRIVGMAEGWFGGVVGGLYSFFEKRGISPAPAIGFLLLVAVAAVLLAAYAIASPKDVRAVVLSSGTGLDGALVEAYSSDGALFASGETSAGKVSFLQGLPASGRIVLKASKDGFVSADGSRQAIAVVDLSRRRDASIDLYSSDFVPGEFFGAVSFVVLDSLSRRPVAGASVDVLAQSETSSYTTNASGVAVFWVPRGIVLRVKTKADNYYPDTRAYTALRGAEEILLKARVLSVDLSAAQQENESRLSQLNIYDGAVSFDSNPVQLSMPRSTLEVSDAQGRPIVSGTVSIVSPAGQVIFTLPVSQGRVVVDNLPVGENFSVVINAAGSEGGTVAVVDSASGQRIVASQIFGGAASLSPAPFSTLSILVQTPSGVPVDGSVRAYDSITGALWALFPVRNGIAVATGITPDSHVSLSFDAAGYYSSPVAAVFGRQPSAKIIAQQVALANVVQTVFTAVDSNGNRLQANLKLYGSSSVIPVYDGGFPARLAVDLQAGSYSAVFSSPGFYPVQFDSFLAGSTVEAIMPREGSTATVRECVTYGGVATCESRVFRPSGFYNLAVAISGVSGAPVQGVLVSARDAGGRTVSVARTGPEGIALFEALAAGIYSVAASGYGASNTTQVILSSDSQATIGLRVTGIVFVSARSGIDGVPVAADFRAGSASCSGEQCALAIEAGVPVSVKAEAEGFIQVSQNITVQPGQVVSAVFSLPSNSDSVSVQFLGVRDSTDNRVDSLVSGRDYWLYFSLYGDAQDETSITVRLGEASSVAAEGYGIRPFEDAAFDFVFKSTSYSPAPTCVDLNNNNPADSLFKWTTVGFSNKGVSVRKTIAIPIRVKPSNHQKFVKAFYRAEAKSGDQYVRVPADSVLATGGSSDSKAGCYADFRVAVVPVSLVNACMDGTVEGACSSNSPLSCSRNPAGSLALVPLQSCCPQAMNLSDGLCAAASVPAGSCKDATIDGECSLVNKPYLCQAGALFASRTCCAFGELFDAGVCRLKGAGCNEGAVAFEDGACLPSKPSRCLDGFVGNDASACGCPQGQAIISGVCISSYCSDGTPNGQCSQSPESRLGKCLDSVFVSSPDCSCPAASRASGSGCVACLTADCGAPLPSLCQFGGALFSQGCIAGNAPLYCGAGGVLSPDAVACGCPQGKSFDVALKSCITSRPFACSDGTFIASCSLGQPSQCVLSNSKPILVDNALACGCPSGKQADGLSCVVAPVILSPKPSGTNATPTPSAQASPSPTPSAASLQATDDAPAVSCSKPNSCLAPDVSDEFCNSGRLVERDCVKCAKFCGNNPFLYCSNSTKACEALSCKVSGGAVVLAGQCAESLMPKRCELQSGVPALLDRPAQCGCPRGFKPSANASACVACSTNDCRGDPEMACIDLDGKLRSAGMCLPSKFTTLLGGMASPILKCLANGTAVADIAQCGCPDGFSRNFNNSNCVQTPVKPKQVESAPACAGCVENESVFFNPSTGKLETRSGQTAFTLQADPVFPADAMKLAAETGQAGAIILKKIESSSGTEACYSYNPVSGVLLFKAVRPCPFEARGNSIYNVRTDSPATDDSVKLTLATQSLPPRELVLDITVNFASADSIIVAPQSVIGGDTPQLIFIFNRKQTAFGPRSLSLLSNSSQSASLASPDVKVLAWRGPGTLSISEGGEQLASLYYGSVPPLFVCADGTGPRVESSCDGNPNCCAGAWCDGNSFAKMFDAFKTYAQDLASQTAFRRGNGEPWKTIVSAGTSFKVNTAAQVVDGSPGIIAASGISLSTPQQCSNLSRPGAYIIDASTGDGKSFKYSARVAGLQKFDYVGGSCGDDSLFVSDPNAARLELKSQPLCDFLYGDCSCVRRTSHSIMPTGQQNSDGNDMLSNMMLMSMLSQMLQQQDKKEEEQGGGGGGGGGGWQQNPINDRDLNKSGVPPGGLTPATPLDIKFGADKFRSSCEDASRAYVKAQTDADSACSPPTPPEKWPQEDFLRKGSRENWVSPAIAKVSEDGKTFEMSLFKNNGEIAVALHACEKKERGPVSGKDAANSLDKTCADEVKAAIGSLREKISKDVEDAAAKCSQACTALASPEDCKAWCGKKKDAVIAELTVTLGASEDFSGVAKGEKDGSGAGAPPHPDSCAAAVWRELAKGGECDVLNAYLEEDKESPLPPAPTKRKSWATCYAQEEPDKGEKLGCVAVCQSKHSFAQLGTKNKALVQVNRWGIGSQRESEKGVCIDRAPAKASELEKMTSNMVDEMTRRLRDKQMSGNQWKTPIQPVINGRFTKEQAGPIVKQIANTNEAYLGPGEKMENLINNMRVALGLYPLRPDPALREECRKHAYAMANRGSIGHDGFSQRLSNARVGGGLEIVAMGGGPGVALNLFYGSSKGHWEAMITTSQSHFGGYTTPNGYTCVDFGTRPEGPLQYVNTPNDFGGGLKDDSKDPKSPINMLAQFKEGSNPFDSQPGSQYERDGTGVLVISDAEKQSSGSAPTPQSIPKKLLIAELKKTAAKDADSDAGEFVRFFAESKKNPGFNTVTNPNLVTTPLPQNTDLNSVVTGQSLDGKLAGQPLRGQQADEVARQITSNYASQPDSANGGMIVGDLIDAVNKLRLAHGLNALQFDPQTQQSVNQYAGSSDFVRANYGHNNDDALMAYAASRGGRAEQITGASNTPGRGQYEGIYAGMTIPNGVAGALNLFSASEGHWRVIFDQGNMLNSRATHIAGAINPSNGGVQIVFLSLPNA